MMKLTCCGTPATRSLFERKDVIVVASISCIYGLGIPSEYLKAAIPIRVGEEMNQRQIIRDLASVQYSRNDLELGRGKFRVKGDVLEIGPAYEDRIIRIEFFGDEIDAIRYVDPVTGSTLKKPRSRQYLSSAPLCHPRRSPRRCLQTIFKPN